MMAKRQEVTAINKSRKDEVLRGRKPKVNEVRDDFTVLKERELTC